MKKKRKSLSRNKIYRDCVVESISLLTLEIHFQQLNEAHKIKYGISFFVTKALLALANFYARLSGVPSHQISDYWSCSVCCYS
jgi:hypothetical protein